MARKICFCAVIAVLMWSSIQHASALGGLQPVTKETQAALGLSYTLTAERVSDGVVLVSMEILKVGKLRNLRGVGLAIGDGTPQLAAQLQTTPGKGGAARVTFQLSNQLANSCTIRLIAPLLPRFSEYVVYAVELKGYVKDRK